MFGQILMTSVFDCCDIFFADFDMCLLAQLYLLKFLFKEHLPGLWLQWHRLPLCLSMDSSFAALQLHTMSLEFFVSSVLSLEFLLSSVYSTRTSYSMSGVNSQLGFPITCASTTYLLIFQVGFFVLSRLQDLHKAPVGHL